MTHSEEGTKLGPDSYQQYKNQKFWSLFFQKPMPHQSGALMSLVQILECQKTQNPHNQKTTRQLVFPIFYNVGRQDVRKLGEVSENLLKLTINVIQKRRWTIGEPHYLKLELWKDGIWGTLWTGKICGYSLFALSFLISYSIAWHIFTLMIVFQAWRRPNLGCYCKGTAWNYHQIFTCSREFCWISIPSSF